MSRRLVALGDVHNDFGNLAAIPELAEATGLILTGDLTNHGGPAQAGRLLDQARSVYPGRIFAQIGNMDKPELDDWLNDREMNLHGRVQDLGALLGETFSRSIGIMGLGWSTPTPFGTPSEASESQYEAWIAALEDEAKRFEALIFVSHTPPYNTACDRIGSGVHVGGKAIRGFIERVQPEVCLTGHIHEARSMDSIGRTVIVNPGLAAEGGYALVHVDEAPLRVELQTTVA